MTPLSISIDQLIQKAGNLPPMPQAAQKALALIRDPDSNIADIAAVLSKDQVLTSLVLRWANSAYYGMSHKIASVQHALMVLGMTTVQNLILTYSLSSYLNRAVPGYGLARGDLWRHSMGVALGAQHLLEKYGRSVAEEVYHAGLLCDIGKLAFEPLLRYSDINIEQWKNGSFIDLEQYHFGIDHAALGSEMAKRWRLPHSMVMTIGYHHSPQYAGEYKLLASAVHLADAAMMMLGFGIGRDGLKYRLEDEALAYLHLTEKDLIALVEKVILEVENIEAFMSISSSGH